MKKTDLLLDALDVVLFVFMTATMALGLLWFSRLVGFEEAVFLVCSIGLTLLWRHGVIVNAY